MQCKKCGLDKETHNFELRSNGHYRKQCKICNLRKHSKAG